MSHRKFEHPRHGSLDFSQGSVLLATEEKIFFTHREGNIENKNVISLIWSHLVLAHAKLASKKFGAADDKLPMLCLISDENSDGFPNVKTNGTRNLDSEQKNEMQTPSLVARLMGLDSMPSIQGEKLKKTSSSEIGSDMGGRFANDHCHLSKQDENLEKK